MPRPRPLAPVLIALLFFCISTAAQTYTPTLPDNALSSADPIGVPPQPSKAGTHEAVSNTNGALSFFLPVLSLPQRGGWNLTLGLYNTSPNWTTRSDSGTQIINQNPAPAQTNITYTNGILFGASGGPLNWNLPTLQASVEYAGQFNIGNQQSPVYVPVLCVTNWVFTDWSGNRHPFTNVTECSAIGQQTEEITDSSDGSWLRLDTTNYDSNIIVRTKDGTTYNFPGFATDPYSSCNSPSCIGNGGTANSNAYFYDQYFTSLVDSTGQNTVTYNGSTLTDTIGRNITFAGSGGNTSLTYTDSNGTAQTISVSLSQQTAQNYDFNLVCSAKSYPHVSIGETYGYLNWSEYPSTYTVTLPAVNGVSRVYTLQFDGVGNLVQVNYPAGGYTKYEYQDYGFFRPFNAQSCSRTEHQVYQKRECPLFAGNCSAGQELVTTYTPTPDGSLPYNDSMEIEDFLGDVTYVQNQNLSGTVTFTAPHETSREIFAPGQYPSGKPLRTTQTTYNTYITGVDVQVPASVTTTLNDITPALSTVTNYQYNETVAMLFYCFSGCGGPSQIAIDNPTEIDVYDYATGTGTELKETAQTWMTGGIYDIAQGHLLDRLQTRTVTDPATNEQETLSYGYNGVGDITSKIVGGTNVSSLTTSYQRDNYGNITQMTDPKNNVTNFGYTNTWKNTDCTISGSSAYLTSITDALSHTTTFSYYPCTGLKGSATDPNNQATTYTYDALGRPVNVTRPDTGQTNYSYSDTAPVAADSVTESSSITSSLNKVETTFVDGFGRTQETELASDPDNPDYGYTTYDSVGRIYQQYNPTRCNPPTTNCGESTWGYTTYQYDALDRTLSVTEPDNSVVTTTYSGNFTTVTDEAQKVRKSESDALGRLTNVWEDPNNLNYNTTYSYNAFGDLTNVLQNGSRQRSFQYNGFSQLVSATNPESGNITYTYDNDGNLYTKTSPEADHNPTPGTGSVTVNGSAECVGSTCDTGTIYITVNGYQVNTSYGNSTSSGLASALASALSNSGSPVTASASGSTVNMTSIATGSGSNYSLSTSVTNSNASSTAATGSVTVNGTEQYIGTPATPGKGSVTISGSPECEGSTCDTGTITVTVNGHSDQTTWGHSSDSASSLASALASAINGDSGSYVSASTSGGTVNLTSKATGSSTNYSLSASAVNTGRGFGQAFRVNESGTTLTGGANGSTTYDSGTVSVTINGFNESVSYGQGSVTSTIASALASAFNSAPGSPVTATSSVNVVYFTTVAVGQATNYTLSATSQTNDPGQFSSPSFTGSPSGSTLTGGSGFPTAAFSTSPSGSALTGGANAPTGTVTYAYDALNRLTEKSYTDGTATVTYGYDGVAPSGCSPTLSITNGIYQRTGMCDGAGWEAWSYNPTGHVTDDRRSTNSIVHDTLYTPNLDASDASVTYPITGRVMTYTPGGAGLPLSASDGSITYGGSAHYAPQGALAYVQNGSNLYSTYIYNDHLQPCWMYTTTGSALSWNSTQCSGSSTTGSVLDLKYNFNIGAGDNGNVIGITNDRDSTRSQAYSYDTLNRIATGGTSNTSGTNCWGEQFGIDAWGNVSSRSLPSSYSGGCGYETPFSYTIGNNNQLPSGSGFTYDAAGNLIATGSANYSYNAEEEMTSEMTGGVTVTYLYDGDGRRVEKSNGTIYWYGMNGAALDETDLSGNLTNEYVFFGGKRIARRDSSSNIFYYFADDLGTSREIVQSGQTSACYDADFYPYGGEITPYVNSCPQNYKFTGKERDAESGLDDFGARFYTSNFSRFVSPDWAANATAVPYANFGNPQSLNLYSYVRNNPTTTTDPDGHCDPSLSCIESHFESALASTENGFIKGGNALVKGVTGTVGTIGAGAGEAIAGAFSGNGQEITQGLDKIGATVTLMTVAPEGGEGAVTEGLGTMEGVGAGEGAAATEGIYEFPDASAPGKTYVGQSGDIPNRLSQHASSGRLAEGSEVKTTSVPGGKTAREVAETKRVKELGGTTKQPGSQTSNQRLPVSDARMKKINGQSQ